MRLPSNTKSVCGYSIILVPNYVSGTHGIVNYLKAAGKADFDMK